MRRRARLSPGQGRRTIGHLQADAILFDLDGVLVDSVPLTTRLLRRWADMHGLDAQRVLLAGHGRTDQELVAEVAPHLDVVTEVERLTGWELADFSGCTATPGAAEILRTIPAGAWAVVTSAMREAAEGRLAAAGLPVPEVLVCAEDVPLGKPHPLPYLTGARRLGLDPGRCIVVEDAPAGVASGRAAGMLVVGVVAPDREAWLGADVRVGSLADVTVTCRRASPRLTVSL